jgi:hypothetical protein
MVLPTPCELGDMSAFSSRGVLYRFRGGRSVTGAIRGGWLVFSHVGGAPSVRFGPDFNGAYEPQRKHQASYGHPMHDTESACHVRLA